MNGEALSALLSGYEEATLTRVLALLLPTREAPLRKPQGHVSVLSPARNEANVRSMVVWE